MGGMLPRTLILRAAGTNCDRETAHAFELAGSDPRRVHINRLLERPALLEEYQILAIPGGFSYGDDIAAGRILANQITHHLADVLKRFVEAGKPIIGICNGFQVLVKTELLPGAIGEGQTGRQTATLTNNDCGRFINRWVNLCSKSDLCIWTRHAGSSEPLPLPIAHGEGKFIPANESVRRQLWENDQVALIYCREDGSPARGEFPDNPNGSVDDIAGICDRTGLVFGLMPHPERFVSPWQHPAWTSLRQSGGEGRGLRLFRNAVAHVQQVGAGV